MESSVTVSGSPLCPLLMQYKEELIVKHSSIKGLRHYVCKVRTWEFYCYIYVTIWTHAHTFQGNFFKLPEKIIHIFNYLGTKKLEDQLFAEIRGRIKEDDISAPLRKGPYYYYEKTLEGKEYVQHCRRLVSDNQKVPSVYDTMPTGPESPQEHVILDENIKAQQHEFYSIGAFKVR